MFRDEEDFRNGGGNGAVPMLYLVGGEKRPYSREEVMSNQIACLPWNQRDLVVSMTAHTTGVGKWTALMIPGAMHVVPTSYPIVVIKGQTVTVDIRRTDRR